MRIALIVVKEEGVSTDDSSPWGAGAWDEWTLDENYEGFEEELAKVKKSHKGCDVRVAHVRVPDSFLTDIFKPVEVQAKV